MLYTAMLIEQGQVSLWFVSSIVGTETTLEIGDYQ